MKKLGFGCMRLPMKGSEVDYDEMTKMVDLFIKEGFTYFDTAHGYIQGKSEIALRECLVKRYPRDKYTITATKADYKAGSLELFVQEDSSAYGSVRGKIQFEDGTHYIEGGKWSASSGPTGATTQVDTPVLDSTSASGGKYVGNLALGCKETINFTTSAPVSDLTLEVVMASAKLTLGEAGPSIVDLLLSSDITVTIDSVGAEEAVSITADLADLMLPGCSSMNFENYVQVDIPSIDLTKAGNYSVTFEFKGSDGINLDCINFLSDETVTVTKTA